MKCIRPNCPNRATPGKHRGYCWTHYGNLRKGFMPADECREHVRALRAAGYSLRRIAAESGLHKDTLKNLGEWTPGGRVRVFTYDRIMGIPLPRRMVSGGAQSVPNVGTKRRLQALVAAGYPIGFIADQFGTTHQNIGFWLRRDYVQAQTLEKVRDLFERLQLQPGPSERARLRAQREGWPPPLAWEEDEIDNPDAVPHMPKGDKGRAWLDTYEELRAVGLNDHRIAERMGIKRESMRRHLQKLAA